MHYACMIVGPDPEQQLEPFSEHLEMPRYRDFMDQDDIQLMAEHFSIAPTDLGSLAAKMPEWAGAEGGIEDGRLYRWSTANPKSKYDRYQLGGRFPGYLHLKEPRQPTGWRKLFGAKPKTRVEQARKAEILDPPLLADPPAALLLSGEWYECPFTSDPAVGQRWKEQFASLFKTVPVDALLTVMDLHS